MLAKSKSNKIKLISKGLIDSVISNDEFVLINNVTKEDDKMKSKILIINKDVLCNKRNIDIRKRVYWN